MTQVTEQETYVGNIRGREYTFSAGDLVTCWKSGYYVVQSFFVQPNSNHVYARVKKIYKTREPMRRPSSYSIRASSMAPVSSGAVENMFSIESERARTKYNTLIQFAKN